MLSILWMEFRKLLLIEITTIYTSSRLYLRAISIWTADIVETHQYSVTSHERSLEGGKDEVHPGTVHAKGGIPGFFVSYDISPMKVVNREVRLKSFAGFLTGVCAIIGGTLTVAAALDRGLYEGAKRMGKIHQR